MNAFEQLNNIRRQLENTDTREQRKRLSRQYRLIKKQTGIKDIVIENLLIRKEKEIA